MNPAQDYINLCFKCNSHHAALAFHIAKAVENPPTRHTKSPSAPINIITSLGPTDSSLVALETSYLSGREERRVRNIRAQKGAATGVGEHGNVRGDERGVLRVPKYVAVANRLCCPALFVHASVGLA